MGSSPVVPTANYLVDGISVRRSRCTPDKDWDKLDDDVKLNAIGILVLDENGKIKTQKIGRRSWGKGAGIGVVLAALTPPGLLAGALAGGVLGGLHHKGLGVDSAEREQIADALSNGQAAVGALVAADRGVGSLRQAHRARRRTPRAESHR